ncbi:hypothetical protein GmHk_17G049028 [Glycine max]|nr:hypothetical protein GmHk_17G049028 [Glycine max]
MHLGGHRKINNYKEYFLEKLSCGKSRVRNRETYTNSIPLSETSTEHDLYLFSIETSLNNNIEEKDNSIKHMESQTQRSHRMKNKKKAKTLGMRETQNQNRS